MLCALEGALDVRASLLCTVTKFEFGGVRLFERGTFYVATLLKYSVLPNTRPNQINAPVTT